MGYFNKRYHPAGTAPGTFKRPGQPAAPVTIRLVDYTAADYSDQLVDDPQACLPFLKRDSITWIHVQGDPAAATLTFIGEAFGIHALALEDIANTGQRPKTDFFDDQAFVVLAHVSVDQGEVGARQVSLVVGENYVISFHEGAEDPFEPVRKRLRQRSGRIRSRGADYLLYALMDVIVDLQFPVLEWFGGELEDLEEELLERPDQDTLRRLYDLKRELLFLRRIMWPQREVVSAVAREDVEFLKQETRLFLRDCYDHSVQLLDMVETYRDMSTSMLDVYLSSVSNRLNDVMRVLTVIATVFIPLTFIVGIYGMNFGADTSSPYAMPELRWRYGYPFVWLVMLTVVAFMLRYFRRRGWI